MKELELGKSAWSLDTFFNTVNEVVKFDTQDKSLNFRIDCGVGNDPEHPNNSKKSTKKAVRLYYLQLQDNQKGRSRTYANVVYPQMDTDTTKNQEYEFSELIDAIIHSLQEHVGYYLYV